MGIAAEGMRAINRRHVSRRLDRLDDRSRFCERNYFCNAAKPSRGEKSAAFSDFYLFGFFKSAIDSLDRRRPTRVTA
jgi:hypothetical protein